MAVFYKLAHRFLYNFRGLKAGIAIAIIASIYYVEDERRRSVGRDLVRETRCSIQLKEIDVAVNRFASMHNGKLPSMLQQLGDLPNPPSPALLVCPASDCVAAHSWSTVGKNNTSYLYMGAGLSRSDSPDSIVLLELAGNHGDRCHILLLDGRVLMVNIAELQQYCRRDNGGARKRGHS
jgi:hypothetical protein